MMSYGVISWRVDSRALKSKNREHPFQIKISRGLSEIEDPVIFRRVPWLEPPLENRSPCGVDDLHRLRDGNKERRKLDVVEKEPTRLLGEMGVTSDLQRNVRGRGSDPLGISETHLTTKSSNPSVYDRGEGEEWTILSLVSFLPKRGQEEGKVCPPCRSLYTFLVPFGQNVSLSERANPVVLSEVPKIHTHLIRVPSLRPPGTRL